MTVGSFAFQLGLQAGWFNSLTWLAPWAWGTSGALWVWWLISHPKIEKEWLRGFHEKVGKGIHPIRLALALLVLLVIGFVITALVRKPQQMAKTQDTITQSVPQQQTQSLPVVTAPASPKTSHPKSHQQSKPSGPSTSGNNNPTTQQSNSGGINTQQTSPGSINQNNAGGVNVLQGTTGPNSPIIGSPITVGAKTWDMVMNKSSQQQVIDKLKAGVHGSIRVEWLDDPDSMSFSGGILYAFIQAGWTHNPRPNAADFRCVPTEDWNCHGLEISVRNKNSDLAKAAVSALSILSEPLRVTDEDKNTPDDLVTVWVCKP
jgi:hypothetical protein